MTVKKILPVILAGGTGTRLWPESRSSYPKQFLSFDGNLTMFQDAVKMLENFHVLPPMVITNESYRFIVMEQLRLIGIDKATVILESEGRSTGPAVCAASLLAKKLYPEEDFALFVLSSDHLIKDKRSFDYYVNFAALNLIENNIVTFGITPTYASTGYGYIKANLGPYSDYSIEEFVEKPQLIDAMAYIKDGSYLWNSGMFMAKPDTFIEETKKYATHVYNNCTESFDESQDGMFVRLNDNYLKCDNVALDVMIMEHTFQGKVIPCEMQWSDLGTWDEIWKVSHKDENQNVKTDKTFTLNSKNNLVRSNKVVNLIGIEDLIVVDTKDALLISHVDYIQCVKDSVQQLKDAGRSEASEHVTVNRPWGNYESISVGTQHQVKIIEVLPGAKLSVQSHEHRSEHWVVVEGVATVRNGEEDFELTFGQSTYIPNKVIHSLENKTEEVLKIIEVQVGTYLGEDDIVRYSDRYGRK